MSAAANISRDADILACFGQVVPVQPAVPVRRTRRPYKLSGFVSRFHLGTARRRGNTFRGEIFSRTEKENRVESLPSPNSKRLDADLNCRPPTFKLLSYLMIFIIDANMFSRVPTFHVGAYICIGAVASWNIS